MTKQEIKQAMLDELHAQYKNCTLCPLGSLGRTQIVFGRGNADATLLLIGEGPGQEEDLQGKPFVGRSGQFLTKTLAHLGFNQEDIYITNIVKCRPPENRTPSLVESETCTNLLLKEQIKIISPKLICTLGSCATTILLKTKASIGSLRSKIHHYQNTPVVPTYHPAYILRSPNKLPLLVHDLELIKNILISNKK